MLVLRNRDVSLTLRIAITTTLLRRAETLAVLALPTLLVTRLALTLIAGLTIAQTHFARLRKTQPGRVHERTRNVSQQPVQLATAELSSLSLSRSRNLSRQRDRLPVIQIDRLPVIQIDMSV